VAIGARVVSFVERAAARNARAIMTLVLIASLFVTGTLAQSPDPALFLNEGILLLRNGQTLEGNVTRTGDYYLVTRGATSEVRLNASNVERVCENREALYQHKLSIVQRGSFAGHLELARWCLQHDLPDRAADQALMAYALKPSDAGLNIVERQLVASQRPADDTLAPEVARSSVPTLPEIEAKIDSLSTGTVQEFVTSIQPLLMNRCATSGCHGHTGQSDFQLLRPSTRQSLSRRMTQRNLVATLQYVDREDPRKSRLVDRATKPHAGRGAVLSETETHQIELLARWVGGLGTRRVAGSPQTVAKPPAVLLQTRPDMNIKLLEGFGNMSETTGDPQSSETPETVTATPIGDYEPRDPFDPELFNRRYHRSTVESK